MRKCFLTTMQDHGRMPSRVLQALDHVPIPVERLSMTRREAEIFLDFIVDADEKQAYRIESLLWKVYGMLSVEVQSAAEAASPSGGREKALPP